MKNSSVFLILGIFILSVGLAWIISGGMTEPATATVPPTRAPATATVVPETTAAVSVVTEVIPATTALPPVTPATILTTTTVPKTTTPAIASSEDIRAQFLDVAYSNSNRLERLNYSSGQSRVVISALSASEDDLALIEETAKEFNDASPTVKLSENVKETGTGDIFIKFLPEEGLAAVRMDDAPESGSFTEPLTRRELYQGSVPAAKIIRGNIYINTNLRGDARKHVLVRSMMYEMGLTGESPMFPDSVFYAGENTNGDLTTADKKVISMLYTQGIYNGITMEELQKVIYLP